MPHVEVRLPQCRAAARRDRHRVDVGVRDDLEPARGRAHALRAGAPIFVDDKVDLTDELLQAYISKAEIDEYRRSGAGVLSIDGLACLADLSSTGIKNLDIWACRLDLPPYKLVLPHFM